MLPARKNRKFRHTPLFSIFFILFAAISREAEAAIPRSRPTGELPSKIRVLIGAFPRVSLSGVDLLLNHGNRQHGKSYLALRCGHEGEGGAGYVDYGAGRRALGKLEVIAPTGFLQVNDKPYRDRLTIYARDGKCAVVNTVDLELYLAGLITREMSPSWPLEALKAQSVAARSYAVYQMQSNRSREYDLESSTLDQVYEGSASETPRSHLAVQSTRGLVLTYGESPLKAYFHANCGGMTEVPEFVWGGEVKAFRPVACPYHSERRNRQHWSVHLTRSQIEGAIRKISGILPRTFVRLAALEAGATNASQRLTDVMVSDTDGNSLVVSANAFRNAIGNTKVKSTSFEIRPEGSGYTLSGEGFGHGVGMCQIGARAMAEEGKTYQQILAYYYPLAKIRHR